MIDDDQPKHKITLLDNYNDATKCQLCLVKSNTAGRICLAFEKILQYIKYLEKDTTLVIKIICAH